MIRWQEMLCRPTWYQPSTFPGIGEKKVHVWRWNHHAHARDIDYLMKTLDSDERERSDRFVRAVDRNRYVVNHGLTRYLLSGYTGCLPEEITFARNDFGKPFLKGGVAESSIDFNVSDSGHMGIVAVSRGLPVGVDVERVRLIADRYQLVQEVFTGKEFRLLDGIREECIEEVFFFCWTRKEAVLKAMGTGLSTSLKEFITIPCYQPIYLENNNRVAINSSGMDWKITSYWAANGYLSALATSKDVMEIDYFNLGLSTKIRPV